MLFSQKKKNQTPAVSGIFSFFFIAKLPDLNELYRLIGVDIFSYTNTYMKCVHIVRSEARKKCMHYVFNGDNGVSLLFNVIASVSSRCNSI